MGTARSAFHHLVQRSLWKCALWGHALQGHALLPCSSRPRMVPYTVRALLVASCSMAIWVLWASAKLHATVTGALTCSCYAVAIALAYFAELAPGRQGDGSQMPAGTNYSLTIT